MALWLKILSGPLENQFVELKKGSIIGRSLSAHLSINDPKMSSQHVKIIEQNGNYAARDLGSKNGFKINGEKLKEARLYVGQLLKIGSTSFEVVNNPNVKSPSFPVDVFTVTKTTPKSLSDERKLLDRSITTAMPLAPTAAPQAPAPQIFKARDLDWNEYFCYFIEQSKSKVQNRPKKLQAFQKLCLIHVVQGLQAQQKWTLGYGPRAVGPHSLDVVIEDPEAPPICFVVEPAAEGLLLKIQDPEKVKVNHQSLKSCVIKDGDLISFGSTKLRLHLLDAP